MSVFSNIARALQVVVHSWQDVSIVPMENGIKVELWQDEGRFLRLPSERLEGMWMLLKVQWMDIEITEAGRVITARTHGRHGEEQEVTMSIEDFTEKFSSLPGAMERGPRRA